MTSVRKSQKLLHAAQIAGRWLGRPQAVPEKCLYSLGWRTTDGLRMPNFLGIGAQKAGTTWLHQNLQKHPDFYFPPDIKEIRFFDARFYMSLSEYAAYFEPAGQRLTGDITPGYGALGKRRIRFVRNLMPDLKLVLILRNPVERAWSHAVMDLLDTPGRRAEDVEDWEFYAHFDAPSARRNGIYSAMLDNWLSVFHESSLLLAFFEDIRERPQELLRSVFRHLGATDDVDWTSFPYREQIKPGVAEPIPERFLVHLQALYREEVERLAIRLGGPVEGWR
ncbi:sulfotransferase domain-containing protein [Myxococcota bacterium]|nr:sulfotransferase domain-containing protein [Myxococcota bacterium]